MLRTYNWCFALASASFSGYCLLEHCEQVSTNGARLVTQIFAVLVALILCVAVLCCIGAVMFCSYSVCCILVQETSCCRFCKLDSDDVVANNGGGGGSKRQTSVTRRSMRTVVHPRRDVSVYYTRTHSDYAWFVNICFLSERISVLSFWLII